MCASDVQTGAGSGKSRPATEHPPDRRLSRKQRLTASHMFREAFDAGRRHVGKFMVMWLRKSEDGCLRLGVVASKRSFRRSVDRSRARRLLREAYRQNRFRFSGNVDVVLVARTMMAGAKMQPVEKELLGLAEKAGILRTKQ